jgi:DNA-binding transcriptional regulator YiaG
MFALVASATDELTQSTNFDRAERVSLVDTWIGSRVRIKRTSRGISGREFCRFLSIDGSELTAFESGEKRINANLLLRIAELMDVRPEWFFRGYSELQN